MTSLSVYHFPETDLDLDQVRAQLLFFSQLFFLQAMEDGDEAQPGSELCQGYVPAPLGDDLERFKKLLAELKGNEAAFYQGQLSNMALEYMENRSPETVREIIGSLHSPERKSPVPDTAEHERQELWQARLLLKLAEILRQEQRELAAGLSSIKDRQAELLQELKGEEELQDIFHALSGSLSPQFPVRIESLIKAWGHLLLAGKERPWFINCQNPEAAEPFFEANESLSGQRPVRLLRLPLATCNQDLDTYLARRSAWQEQTTDCRAKMAASLETVAQAGLNAGSLAKLTQLASQWTVAMDQHNPCPEPPIAPNPAKASPTPYLEIYFLHQPIAQLVGKLCGSKVSSDGLGPMKHGLLALLSCRSSTCKG